MLYSMYSIQTCLNYRFAPFLSQRLLGQDFCHSAHSRTGVMIEWLSSVLMNRRVCMQNSVMHVSDCCPIEINLKCRLPPEIPLLHVGLDSPEILLGRISTTSLLQLHSLQSLSKDSQCILKDSA